MWGVELEPMRRKRLGAAQSRLQRLVIAQSRIYVGIAIVPAGARLAEHLARATAAARADARLLSLVAANVGQPRLGTGQSCRGRAPIDEPDHLAPE